MYTKWSLVLAVITGCASSKAPQTSEPAPAHSHSVAAAAATTAVAPPPAATNATTAKVAKPEPKIEHAAKLTVKRLTIAKGIDHREPVDAATSFDVKTQKVFAFVEVDNPQKLPGEITVEFQPPSKKYEGLVTLGVGESSRFRTWAYTRQAHEAGEWTAIVRDERGHELARQKFDVSTT